MRVYAAVFALCVIAAFLTSEPCCGSEQHQEPAAASWQRAIPAVGAEKDHAKATDEAEAPDKRHPSWCTALKKSEWWLVIIAAMTGFAIAYQAREMTRATGVMQGQMNLMNGQLAEMSQQTASLREYVEETKKISESGLKAANAAHDNVELYINKVRARLRVDIKPLTFPSQTDPAYSTVDFTVSIYGPTDAFITESSCTAYFYPWQVIDNPDLADSAMLPIHSLPSVIKANSPPIECFALLNIDASISGNDKVIIAEIKAKHLAVGIRGWIKFRDVFGRDRETAFRYLWRYNDATYGLCDDFGDWIKRGNPEENRET